MATFNRVTVIGNLVRDPELKYLPSGSAVCQFAVAVNRKFKPKDGEEKDEVSFFDVVAWNRTAETCAQYLKKGRPVLIDGRLEQRRWQTPEGQNRSAVRIVAENVQFLGGRRDEGQDGGGGEAPPEEGPPPEE